MPAGTIPVLGMGNNVVTWGDNREQLSRREAEVLFVVLEKHPTPAAYQYIVMRVWGDDGLLAPMQTLCVLMRKLRAKMAKLGWKIRAIRGIGYALEPITESPASAT